MGKWRDLIAVLYADHEFRPHCSSSAIVSAESKLGQEFPDDLKALLLETNGVFGSYGLPLVWPLDRIVADNTDFRSRTDFVDLYMPFSSLLFFADAGNGDQFAFSILNDKIRKSDVFAWNHENDSRMWVAPDLGRYFEWWASGKLKI